MRNLFFILLAVTASGIVNGQTPKTYTSSELLLQLKKLNVLGSVLYIAAHPDDENTRLLAYLANEKLYRTGYLSLTRGDGGQNLIGDEQGIELGLIRTQELLAARRIDGAEQFFTRAYDFGFSKSSTEALQMWDHDKTLSDVVWVIRKFKPDVIVARFPEDARAGHGHHAASGILAREAFEAAGDPKRFPEQLTKGVAVWQPKRILWNTFNFGSGNTQSEDQFKLDVGMYNPLLGKGYGEIASLSRSQHKSQGFGVAAQRGEAIEYFAVVKGDKPAIDLLDGVDASWRRIGQPSVEKAVTAIIDNFSAASPAKSVSALVQLYRTVQALPAGYWKDQKLVAIAGCIEQASGLFMDITTNSQFAVSGDSLQATIVVNDRYGLNIPAVQVAFLDGSFTLPKPGKNQNKVVSRRFLIPAGTGYSQPFWLQKPMNKGSFNIDQQEEIGLAENEPVSALFQVDFGGTIIPFKKPIRYKYTDPVRGELYQPLSILPVSDLQFDRDIYLFKPADSMHVDLVITPNTTIDGEVMVNTTVEGMVAQKAHSKSFSFDNLVKQKPAMLKVELPVQQLKPGVGNMQATLTSATRQNISSGTYTRIIGYDHIPSIVYQKEAVSKLVYADIKIAGKLVGYIAGAGDKVPAALTEMGYTVVQLSEHDIKTTPLHQYDAIVTGVRAYNTNDWMGNVYDELMNYVKEGGVLLTQYNTSNQLGPVRSRMAPYPFSISRNRVTDENATIEILLPDHPALNYPNKITTADFDGWIQERSIYNADNIDGNFQRILGMKDPGENTQDGSLIIANYGKGRFVYTGLVFFRELPAGVPGAYRLFANLIAATGQVSSRMQNTTIAD